MYTKPVSSSMLQPSRARTAAGQMLNVSFVSETEDCKDTRGCDGRGGGIYMLDG